MFINAVILFYFILFTVENLDIKIKNPINLPEIKPLKNGEAVLLIYYDNLTAIYIIKYSDVVNYNNLLQRTANDKCKYHFEYFTKYIEF